MHSKLLFASGLLLVCVLFSCRREEIIPYSQQESIATPPLVDPEVVGFYVLNSGVRGNNEATLDYFDYTTSIYHRNIYAERNTEALPNLGDFGQDIVVADGKLYVTLSGSHQLEIFDAATTQRIGTVSINNPRRILVRDNYVYVTSYLKQKDQIYGELPLGELVRINVNDLNDVKHITLGCQPEEMVAFTTSNESSGVEKENMLFVANTGVYNSPKFDNRISIVNLDNYVQTGYIHTATSPRSLAIVGRYLYVSTMGNRTNEPQRLCILRDKTKLNFFVQDTACDLPILSFVQLHDTLYMLQGRRNLYGDIREIDFVKYSTKSDNIVERFITDGTEVQIENPTSVTVHPVTYDLYITDARRGTSSGLLYCYSPSGVQKWKVKTGIAPCRVAFVKK